YESSDEGVIATSPGGFLRVVGNGRAQLTVRNRGREGRLDVVVKSEAEPNGPPVAKAGADQTVHGGATVALSALESRDPDGDPLRYEWSQIRGNKVSLLDADSPKATFVAPKVSAKRLFRFKLRVTDMKGPDTVKGADSLPSYVDVWVVP
ncbi:MAG: PKD domain-containing protein, partial [Nitrospiraceae bacterium]